MVPCGSVVPAVTAALAMVLFAAPLSSGGDDRIDTAVRLAREALARELQTAIDDVVVVGVTAVDWPDSSLGCPRPGHVYQPVITPGHRVVLRHGDAAYNIHVGGGHASVCGSSGGRTRDASPSPEPGETDTRSAADAALGLRLAERARSDLAARLKLSRDRVGIDFYRRAWWPDAGLGCPAAGHEREPQPTRGFRIQLSAAGRSYEFHSDLTRVVECPASEF